MNFITTYLIKLLIYTREKLLQNDFNLRTETFDCLLPYNLQNPQPSVIFYIQFSQERYVTSSNNKKLDLFKKLNLFIPF